MNRLHQFQLFSHFILVAAMGTIQFALVALFLAQTQNAYAHNLMNSHPISFSKPFLSCILLVQLWQIQIIHENKN